MIGDPPEKSIWGNAMKNILPISPNSFTRPFAIAFAGLVLIGSYPFYAHQGAHGHGAHADAVDNRSMHGSKRSDAMQGHQGAGDYDGDGRSDLNATDNPAT